jgi:Ca-activated chloride channel family protein
MRGPLVFLLALLALAIAQQPPSVTAGLVAGVVIDSAGSPIAGATVELRRDTRIERTATTDAGGSFRFERVAAGTYELRVRLAGFSMVSRSISVGSAALPALRITLAAAAANETVAVTGETPPPPASPVQSKALADARYPQAAGLAGGFIGHQQPFNTESYARIDEGRYKRTLDEPLSTFSIDVDTASYSNVRRFLDKGQLPPADAVRTEELINYFHFAYPAPKAGDPFSVVTEVAACPWNPQHRLALIGLQTKPLAPGGTPPRNLVFLLDVSGSMATPDKLPLVKTAMRMLADTLTPADRVAIVVYAGASGLALPSTSGDQKSRIKQAIEELTPGGSTNGAAGIRLAYDTAAEHFVKDGINRVILATDGDFNVGVTSEGELTRLIEEERSRGIFLSVLGVGTGNLKDSTMEKLADRGNGNYAYLDTVQEARRVLVAEAGATLVTVAKDVKIQVEFNPRTVGAYRLIGYENRILAKEDFNDDRKDAGEMGAGHAVTALYEIVPPSQMGDLPTVDPLKYQRPPAPAGDRADSGELMTVKLRYKQPDGDTSRLMSVVVSDRKGELSENLGFAASVAEFGMLLRQSEFKGQATWQSARDLARRHRGEDPDGYRAEFRRLIDLASSLDEGRSSDGPPRR